LVHSRYRGNQVGQGVMADGMAELDRSAHVRDVACRHGVHVRAASLVFIDTDIDFHFVLADGEDDAPWTLQLPRRAGVMQYAARQQRLLRVIAPQLPFAVPAWSVLSDELIAYPR